MLKNIYIKNFIIIDELELYFHKGLNIFTGETGAGKSIIFDALAVLLGGKVGTNSLRQESSKCIIEANFELTTTNPIFELLESDFDLDGENNICIRREINGSGKSRIFLNDTPAQVGFIKKLRGLLIDFHGQHEHQSLLNKDTHIAYLDKTGSYHDLLEQFHGSFKDTKSLRKGLQSLKDKELQLLEQQEFERFQLSEIQKVNPKENEDKELEQSLNTLQNAEKLFELSTIIKDELIEHTDSIYNKLNIATSALDELKNLDSQFDDYYSELKSSLVSVKEIASFTSVYRSNIEFNPKKIDEIRLRLKAITNLTKKYGSVSAIINKKKELQSNIDLVESSSDAISELQAKLNDKIGIMGELAMQLSHERQKHAKVFNKNIEDSLSNLGFENAKFEVRASMMPLSSEDTLKVRIDNIDYQVNSNGIDSVEFYISTNKGETLSPLKNSASGGEISRVMLALKSYLSGSDMIETLVFDEIDTGISGRIAQSVGQEMRNLSTNTQIIAITHLPQIAALAHKNFSVIKAEENGRTIANVKVVKDKDKVEEVAKLISGQSITINSLQNAQDLINLN